MTSRDFCFWLQGYLEIAAENSIPVILSAQQLACVQRHLALVFKHEIDPAMGPKAHQDKLNETHTGPGVGPGGLVMRC